MKLDAISYKLNILALFLTVFGAWFIYIANLNGEYNWYSKLSKWELGYYKFLVLTAWYMSANVLLHSLNVATKIYIILQHPTTVNVYDYDGSAGFAEMFKLFFLNVGLALYFSLSVLLIIVSDFNASKYNVENAFKKYPILILFIALLVVFYLIYTIIPLIKVRGIISKNTEEEMKKTEIGEDEHKKLKSVKNSMFNKDNIFRLLSVNFVSILQCISIIADLLEGK